MTNWNQTGWIKGRFTIDADQNDNEFNDVTNTWDEGLEGKLIKLVDLHGNVVATTYTDHDGMYNFDVPPGDYRVMFPKPDGYMFSAKDSGVDDHYDSDADENGLTDVIHVRAGETIHNVDAGIKQKPHDPDCIVIEAEDMHMNGFKMVDGDQASGWKLAKLWDAKGSGDLSTHFDGHDGRYDLTIFVQDEADGQGSIKVKVNGHEVDTIHLNRDSDGGGSNNGSFSEFTLEGIHINKGDKIVLWADGDDHGSEFVRIDKIELKKVDPEPPIIDEVCTFVLENHDSNNGHYGMRLNGLDGNADFTLDFEAPGAAMFATIDPAGGMVSIFGTAVGSDGKRYKIDFKYNNVTQALGDDDLLVDKAFDETNTGSISQLNDDGTIAQSWDLTDESGNKDFTFRLGDENDDNGHRGADSISGWGWLNVDGLRGQTQDFIFELGGKAEPAGIDGRYFRDNDDNDIESAGDTGVNDKIVLLLRDGVEVDRTTTNENGEYWFRGVLPGDGYSVAFENPEGNDEFVTPNVGPANNDSDAENFGADFGSTVEFSLGSGQIKANVDAGIASEPPIIDEECTFLLGNHQSAKIHPEDYGIWIRGIENDTTVLDFEAPGAAVFLTYTPDGKITITGVAAGRTKQPDGSYKDIGLFALDFAYENVVQVDGDNDLIIKPEFDGDFGGTISRLDENGNVIETFDYTNKSGNFGGVVHSLRLGDGFQDQGGPWMKPGKSVDAWLSGEGHSHAGDFHFTLGEKAEPGSIAGRYFLDNNDNDIDDAGDGAVAGATVQLLQDVDGQGLVVIRTTTTDDNGDYSFESLEPDPAYVVRFLNDNDDLTFVDPNVGGDDTIDSDGDQVVPGGIQVEVAVASGENVSDVDQGIEKVDPIVNEPCTFRLLNHPDGALADPLYGLRLDNVFGDGQWTFDFEAEGAAMFAFVDEGIIRIFGTAVGGRDTGTTREDVSVFEIDFTYTTIEQASGDDDLLSDASTAGSNSGTITRLDDQGDPAETVQLTDKAGNNPFSFRFGDTDDDNGHRGFEGKSGWGWLMTDGKDPAGAQDWLFTVGEKVVIDAEDDCIIVTESEKAGDIEVLEDGSMSILENDTVADGQPYAGAVFEVDGQEANVGEFIDLADGGRIKINADGTVDFDAAGDFEDLDEGETAMVSVEYTIRLPGSTETVERVIDFEGLQRGTIVNNQIDGVTISAQRAGDTGNSPNDAMIFDSSNPTGGDDDLGTDSQGNILIISEDGKSNDPDDNAHGGTFWVKFDKPEHVGSITFIDTEEGGATIFVIFADDTNTTLTGPQTANGGIGEFDINLDNVVQLDIHLKGSGAIDDIALKDTVVIPPQEDTATVKIKIQGEEDPGSITGRVFCDDDCDGLQEEVCMTVETPIFMEDVWFAEKPADPVKLEINKAVKSFSHYQGNGTWKSYDTTSDDENGQGDNLFAFGSTVVRFTVSVTNTSDQVATGVVVKDTIPENIDIWQPGESTVTSSSGDRWDNTRWANSFDPSDLELRDTSNGNVLITEPGTSNSGTAIAAGATYGLAEGEVRWELGGELAPGETVELVYYGMRTATYDFGHGTQFTTEAEIIEVDQPLMTNGSHLQDQENVRWISPLAIDLNGNGEIDVTGDSTVKGHAFKVGADTVDFDLNNDGTAETIEWMQASTDGLLLDLDIARATGIISIADDFINGIFVENIQTDGGALFGDEGGTYANGFEKLSLLRDINNDGRVDGAELDGLVVWIDDGDGIVEVSNDPGQNEIRTLDEVGIDAISTEMETDSHGRMVGQALTITETCEYTDKCPDAVGVTVNLLDTNGQVVQTVMTDDDGNYTFATVQPGDYTVQFVAPDGKTFTLQDVNGNGDDDLDSDVDENGEVTVTVGENETVDIDAGFKPTKGSISGRYFNDENRSDIEDGGDTGVDGATVQLFAQGGVTPVAETTTNPDGTYTFLDVDPGDYFVRFISEGDDFDFVLEADSATAGADDTDDSDVASVGGAGNGNTAVFSLSPGEDKDDVDAGIQVKLGAISGRYFRDNNGNNFDDGDLGGDFGIGGQTIMLFLADGVTMATDENGNPLTATTDIETGNYRFDDLLPGDYVVKFPQPPAGTAFVTPNTGDEADDSDVVDLAGGKTDPVTVLPDAETADVDGGVKVSVGSISGRYFDDKDRDDTESVDDPGFDGAMVLLFAAGGTTPINTTMTNSDGEYTFLGVAPGDYFVRFASISDDFDFVLETDSATAGANNINDSDIVSVASGDGDTGVFSLAAGQDLTDVDAGAKVGLGSISGRYFRDTNGNNFDDGDMAGEFGIGFQTIMLLQEDGVTPATDVNGNMLTTMTDPETGGYRFDDLLPGNYVVKFQLPGADSTFIQPNIGDEADDSDVVDFAAGTTAPVAVQANAETSDVDAGQAKQAIDLSGTISTTNQVVFIVDWSSQMFSQNAGFFQSSDGDLNGDGFSGGMIDAVLQQVIDRALAVEGGTQVYADDQNFHIILSGFNPAGEPTPSALNLELTLSRTQIADAVSNGTVSDLFFPQFSSAPPLNSELDLASSLEAATTYFAGLGTTGADVDELIILTDQDGFRVDIPTDAGETFVGVTTTDGSVLPMSGVPANIQAQIDLLQDPNGLDAKTDVVFIDTGLNDIDLRLLEQIDDDTLDIVDAVVLEANPTSLNLGDLLIDPADMISDFAVIVNDGMGNLSTVAGLSPDDLEFRTTDGTFIFAPTEISAGIGTIIDVEFGIDNDGDGMTDKTVRWSDFDFFGQDRTVDPGDDTLIFDINTLFSAA